MEGRLLSICVIMSWKPFVLAKECSQDADALITVQRIQDNLKREHVGILFRVAYPTSHPMVYCSSFYAWHRVSFSRK